MIFTIIWSAANAVRMAQKLGQIPCYTYREINFKLSLSIPCTCYVHKCSTKIKLKFSTFVWKYWNSPCHLISGWTRSNQRAQPRQIITLILPTVKMLSLGCKRLPPPPPPTKKKKSGSLPAPRSGYATTTTVFFCSFTHLTIPRSPPKFNQFFLVLLRTRP